MRGDISSPLYTCSISSYFPRAANSVFYRSAINLDKTKYYLAELCKGSTADSDSVCLGSNPSSAAKEKTTIIRWSFFSFLWPRNYKEPSSLLCKDWVRIPSTKCDGIQRRAEILAFRSIRGTFQTHFPPAQLYPSSATIFRWSFFSFLWPQNYDLWSQTYEQRLPSL